MTIKTFYQMETNIRFLMLLFFLSLALSNAASSRKPSRKTEVEDDALTSDECPEPTGFFADAEQCDKYYQCVDGVITEKLCPDGMVFNDYSTEYEKCDLPFNIDCKSRPKLRKYTYIIIEFC